MIFSEIAGKEGVNLPSVMLAKRADNFEEKFKNNCTFGKYTVFQKSDAKFDQYM